MGYATNYNKFNQRRLLAHVSWVSYHARAIREEGRVSPLLRRTKKIKYG